MKLALICGVFIFAQVANAQGQKFDSPFDTPLLADVTVAPVIDAGSDIQLASCESNAATCCSRPKPCGCANAGYTKSGSCGKCFSWGDNTSLTVGGGVRASYRSMEGGNPANGGRRQDFNLDNARLYFNGQGHERIGFEFNFDINNAQGFDIHGGGFGSLDEGEVRVLDAILKFKLTDHVHMWTGRFLPPSDRSNLSGPYYLNAWTFPFTQFGYSNIFQGRDDGAALWGEYGGGAFKWQVGVFEGESAGGATFIGHPDTDNLMFNARVVLNLLDPEPGYYNSSTYYGEKDILAIAASVMHRSDALSSLAGTSVDYTGWNIDALFETKLANCGVVTVEGAHYDFNDNNGVIANSVSPVTLPPSFGPRQGSSYFVLGSYLFPRKFCLMSVPGQFQVTGRYQEYDRDTVAGVAGGADDQTDVQLNYIMFGHNARISAIWSQFDTPGATGLDVFTIGTQVQF